MRFEFKQFDIKCIGISSNAEHWEFLDEFDKVKSYTDLIHLLNDFKLSGLLPSNRVSINLFITKDFFLEVKLELDEIYSFTYKIKNNEVGFYNI